MSIRVNNESFIKRMHELYKEKFDFSKTNYVKRKEKITLQCKICKRYFQQLPEQLYKGCCICPYCPHISKRRSNVQDFIRKAKLKHGEAYNYDYVDYQNCKTNVKIQCNNCKRFFYQTPNMHLRGCGCSYCHHKASMTKEEFVKKAQQIYGKELYNYDLVEYKGLRQKVKIFCNICKKPFIQEPYTHIKGYGCPKHSKSKGELFINDWLKTNNIEFEIQKRFNDCRDILPLPFDFYIPEKRICIEYQGEQHFTFKYHKLKCKDLHKAEFEYQRTLKHDKMKKDYCKNNDLLLYEITYKDDIEGKLKNLLENFIK